MEIHTRELERELKRELRNTETDRDLWKTRSIRRSMGDGTTVEMAIIERDNWQHKYESEVEAKSNDARLHLALKYNIRC